MIVVAVPTKNKDAFSSPALNGWVLLSLAGGSSLEIVGTNMSRVGAFCLRGSTEICCMLSDNLEVVLHALTHKHHRAVATIQHI